MNKNKKIKDQLIDDLSSMEKYERLEKKLPKRMRPTIYAGSYIYIWTKAAILLKKGADVYSIEDYFHYPDKDMEYDEILSGVMQIANELKGVHPEHCISGLSENGIENLMLIFHFKLIAGQYINDAGGKKVLEIECAHLVGLWNIKMYFQAPK